MFTTPSASPSRPLDTGRGFRLQEEHGRVANPERMAQADLRRVQRAAARVTDAREELIAAIFAAVSSGETYRDIARAAGMSHQRVGQIVKQPKGEPQ